MVRLRLLGYGYGWVVRFGYIKVLHFMYYPKVRIQTLRFFSEFG